MREKIILACMAIAALAAFAPTASATNLKEAGTTLSTGASVTGKNVGIVLFTAGNLTVSCTAAHLPGTVAADAAGIIKTEVAAGATSFTGTGPGGDCTSPLGNVKPTVNSKLCLEVANSDVAKVTGCGANVTFTLVVTNVVSCRYQAATISGEITTVPNNAEINFFEQPVNEEGGLALCPDIGKLDMEFVLTTTDGSNLQFTN